MRAIRSRSTPGRSTQDRGLGNHLAGGVAGGALVTPPLLGLPGSGPPSGRPRGKEWSDPAPLMLPPPVLLAPCALESPPPLAEPSSAAGWALLPAGPSSAVAAAAAGTSPHTFSEAPAARSVAVCADPAPTGLNHRTVEMDLLIYNILNNTHKNTEHTQERTVQKDLLFHTTHS